MNNQENSLNKTHISVAIISFWVVIFVNTLIVKSFNMLWFGKFDSSIIIFNNLCDIEPRFVPNFIIRILYSEILYIFLIGLLIKSNNVTLHNLAKHISLLFLSASILILIGKVFSLNVLYFYASYSYIRLFVKMMALEEFVVFLIFGIPLLYLSVRKMRLSFSQIFNSFSINLICCFVNIAIIYLISKAF